MPSLPSADSAVTATVSGAPGRRIFNVFFCVTVDESIVAAGVGAGATDASVGMTESGIRDVWRTEVVVVLIGVVEKPGLLAGGGEIIEAVVGLKVIGVVEI